MFLFLVAVSRKEQVAEQREYKKKKAQKKVQRMKELEQEREEQKSKWQQFNNKAYSKTKKGQVMFYLYSHPIFVPVLWKTHGFVSPKCPHNTWYVFVVITLPQFSSPVILYPNQTQNTLPGRSSKTCVCITVQN